MTAYTKTGPFTSGAAPGIDAGFLNNVENALVAGGMFYFLTSPYQLMTNPTINAGNTATYTGAGVGSIPSGALAIVVAASITSNAGGYVIAGPHGATLPAGSGSGYPSVGNVQVNGQYASPMIIIPLNSNQFDVKNPSGVNVVLQYWNAFAYIM